MISENATPKNLQLVMNPWYNCKKQEYQVFHPVSDLQYKHDQCKCWSITKGETFFQASIKHLTFHLPFGCIHVKLKLIPNPIPNFLEIPKFIQSTRTIIFPEKGMYRCSKMRERSKTYICSLKVKDVK